MSVPGPESTAMPANPREFIAPDRLCGNKSRRTRHITGRTGWSGVEGGDDAAQEASELGPFRLVEAAEDRILPGDEVGEGGVHPAPARSRELHSNRSGIVRVRSAPDE